MHPNLDMMEVELRQLANSLRTVSATDHHHLAPWQIEVILKCLDRYFVNLSNQNLRAQDKYLLISSEIRNAFWTLLDRGSDIGDSDTVERLTVIEREAWQAAQRSDQSS